MKKEIADLWIKALRSGKYKQCQGELRKNYDDGTASFCCLGVLCNLHAEAHPDLAKTQINPRLYFQQTVTLPEIVTGWSGMRSDIGIPENDAFESLAEENDNGKTFKQIAKLIERNWLFL